MSTFSQRIGKTPMTKTLQINSIDEDLKNSLWNVYELYILDKIPQGHDHQWNIAPGIFFGRSLWFHYFKKPLDQLPTYFSAIKIQLRHYFFSCSWFQLYDFLEYTIELISVEELRKNFDLNKIFEQFNYIFEREFSAYRFVKGIISPITNQTEINEINEVISSTNSFTSLSGCNTHLRDALDKLSDRENPDYRNSIKESISAVEAITKVISTNANDSFSASLNKIKGKIRIHPALEKGFKQIYGFSSDSSGIRHALMDDSTCEFEDAKFMLVACSAFINYLISKSEKSGINLS